MTFPDMFPAVLTFLGDMLAWDIVSKGIAMMMAVAILGAILGGVVNIMRGH
jgi:hypothetical protein